MAVKLVLVKIIIVVGLLLPILSLYWSSSSSSYSKMQIHVSPPYPQPSLQFFLQSATALSGTKIFQVLPLQEKAHESHEIIRVTRRSNQIDELYRCF